MEKGAHPVSVALAASSLLNYSKAAPAPLPLHLPTLAPKDCRL